MKLDLVNFTNHCCRGEAFSPEILFPAMNHAKNALPLLKTQASYGPKFIKRSERFFRGLNFCKLMCRFFIWQEGVSALNSKNVFQKTA
jgi:hypothetical protein